MGAADAGAADAGEGVLVDEVVEGRTSAPYAGRVPCECPGGVPLGAVWDALVGNAVGVDGVTTAVVFGP
jgi:hypothetical protein